jgi:hypothetical protein
VPLQFFICKLIYDGMVSRSLGAKQLDRRRPLPPRNKRFPFGDRKWHAALFLGRAFFQFCKPRRGSKHPDRGCDGSDRSTHHTEGGTALELVAVFLAPHCARNFA